jgi:pyridoxamine 5'-phosphate oxidase
MESGPPPAPAATQTQTGPGAPKGPARRYLDDEDLGPDPIAAFRAWWIDAVQHGQPEPEATALATATAGGRSSVRFVLLRAFDERGFVFYTNSRSRKGLEMAASGWASMAFRWAVVDRQVRVAGPVRPLPAEESDAYFDGRPRGSQLGAWASEQSEELASRADLERRLAEVEARFDGRSVPRPPWWGGYRIEPFEIEFWQQGDNRLHDRFRYTRAEGRWRVSRLHP